MRQVSTNSNESCKLDETMNIDNIILLTNIEQVLFVNKLKDFFGYVCIYQGGIIAPENEC